MMSWAAIPEREEEPESDRRQLIDDRLSSINRGWLGLLPSEWLYKEEFNSNHHQQFDWVLNIIVECIHICIYDAYYV